MGKTTNHQRSAAAGLWLRQVRIQLRRGLIALLVFAGLAAHLRYRDLQWTFVNQIPASPLWEITEVLNWNQQEPVAFRGGEDAPPPEVTNVWQLIGEEEKTPETKAEPEEPPRNVSVQLGFGTGSVSDKTRNNRLAYVKKYASVARREQERYGIPASITLAQGILESVCGQSRLARENNNHFGIKCFSRRCAKGHCTNFEDDHHKDFFRKYGSVWESYRAHSHLLKGKRYKHLLRLDPTDYKGWAHGLKKAGYATDKAYAEKLIQLIEDLDLHRYDRQP